MNHFVAILLTAGFAASAVAQSVSLRDAVDQALARNPAIAAADARQRSAKAREAEARAARFPRLDVTEAATRGNNPVFVFGTLLEQGELAPRHFDPAFLNAPDALTNYRVAATARLAVFDALRTTTAISQARNGAERAAVELEETRQQIRAQVVTAYYGVLVAEERVAVTRDAVRTAEADAKATRDRFDQGLIVESDALSADVQLATLRQRVIAAEGELAIARAALATLLQRPPNESIAVAGTLPTTAIDGIELDEAIARANRRRAPVMLAASGARDAQLQLSAARATALPRVDAFGTFGASGATFGNRNSDHTAGVVVSLELFDRARPARIAAARGEIDAVRAAEAMARDAVTLEVIAAWHRLRAAGAAASVAATAVGQAEAAARIVRDRYGEGLVPITEHLRAQTALVAARSDLLAARYARLTAHADLLRATGDLDDVQPFL
ncbi:MAG TPA: TolC family protein [Thermoanaerobaculia bacterium]